MVELKNGKTTVPYIKVAKPKKNATSSPKKSVQPEKQVVAEVSMNTSSFVQCAHQSTSPLDLSMNVSSSMCR